jgi:hypothetical protein
MDCWTPASGIWTRILSCVGMLGRAEQFKDVSKVWPHGGCKLAELPNLLAWYKGVGLSWDSEDTRLEKLSQRPLLASTFRW